MGCSGSKKSLNRLPVVARRPDENVFIAAQRLLNKTLRMSSNYVTIDPHNITDQYQQMTSLSYPGLLTRCRKRIITAKLNIDNEGVPLPALKCEKRASIVLDDKSGPSEKPGRKPIRGGKIPPKGLAAQKSGAKGPSGDDSANLQSPDKSPDKIPDKS